MKFERITTPEHSLYKEAMKLYKISFPPYEQREEKSQIEILGNAAYHFDVICDEGNFVGEVLYWDIGKFLYIEHFCILPSMRNKHYGQRILAVLREKPLILEIDPPVDAISQRRAGFYKRCGFVENPYAHIHPTYHCENAGHELVVMSAPEMLTTEEYEQFDHYLQNIIMKNAF